MSNPATGAYAYSAAALIQEFDQLCFHSFRIGIREVPMEASDVSIDGAGARATYSGCNGVNHGVGPARGANVARAREGSTTYNRMKHVVVPTGGSNTGAAEVEYPGYDGMDHVAAAAGGGVNGPVTIASSTLTTPSASQNSTAASTQSTTATSRKNPPLMERGDWGVEKFDMYEHELRQIRPEYHLIRSKFFIGKTKKGKEKGPDHHDYIPVTNEEMWRFLELREKTGGHVPTPRQLNDPRWAAANPAASQTLAERLERKRLMAKGLWPPAQARNTRNLSLAQKLEMAQMAQEVQEALDSEEDED
ncbi:hypothetical protein DL98DRAFT_572948 [Cadophora sp. DSE1049]|nr:hypothetical protein DL98DRAFT_572948 [Cadophora sp. DSE1049]